MSALQSPAASRRPHELPIAEAGRLMRAGELSALELTESSLARIDAVGPATNAFIRVMAESAREEARASDARRRDGSLRGPLDGIPVALKDNCDTAGVPTTAGSAVFRTRVPHVDAGCVRRLRDGGAVIIGKANLNEFAHAGDGRNEAFGAMHNPWLLTHSCGGSSGGSAAAVAAGMCLGAVGTDTRGSVRIPAALCGVTGHRPTFGLVGRGGVIPRALTFDTVGPIARDAGGAALLLAVLTGSDDRDLEVVTEARASRALPGAVPDGDHADLVIGVVPDDALAGCEPTVRRNFRESVARLRALGADLRPFRPPAVDPAITTGIAAVELASYLREEFAEQPDALGARLRAELARGNRVGALEYADWLTERRRIAAESATIWREHDAVVMPTVAATAWALDGEATPSLGPFTLWPSVAHLPATSVPNGFDEEGLPTAFQVIAAPFDDARCLHVATAYQSVTDFHLRRPLLS